MNEIKIGDRVRSYDFENRRDCYIIGTIRAIGEYIDGCLRYKIETEGRVWAGETIHDEEWDFVFPPVNGTPARSSETGFTNFVEKEN